MKDLCNNCRVDLSKMRQSQVIIEPEKPDTRFCSSGCFMKHANKLVRDNYTMKKKERALVDKVLNTSGFDFDINQQDIERNQLLGEEMRRWKEENRRRKLQKAKKLNNSKGLTKSKKTDII